MLGARLLCMPCIRSFLIPLFGKQQCTTYSIFCPFSHQHLQMQCWWWDNSVFRRNYSETSLGHGNLCPCDVSPCIINSKHLLCMVCRWCRDGGLLHHLHSYWDRLLWYGPAYGYHANSEKAWLVVKESHLNEARVLFRDTGIKVTLEGRH